MRGPTVILNTLIRDNVVESDGDESPGGETQIETLEIIAIDDSSVQGWTGQLRGPRNGGQSPSFQVGTYQLGPGLPLINAGAPNTHSNSILRYFVAGPTNSNRNTAVQWPLSKVEWTRRAVRRAMVANS